MTEGGRIGIQFWLIVAMMLPRLIFWDFFTGLTSQWPWAFNKIILMIVSSSLRQAIKPSDILLLLELPAPLKMPEMLPWLCLSKLCACLVHRRHWMTAGWGRLSASAVIVYSSCIVYLAAILVPHMALMTKISGAYHGCHPTIIETKCCIA